MSRLYKIFFPILLVTLLTYLPLLANPALFLKRGNDLEEFFWPIYFFVKDQIINHHTLPLWYPHILSGTPLLPDPQAPLFYIPNIIFLLMPINAAFIFSSIAHTLVGGLGMYLAAKKGFGFSKNASYFTSFLYVTSPKLVAFLEAGHFGLVMSWAWMPFTILAITQIIKKPSIIWSVVLALAMSGLFFTHTVTFLIFSALSFATIVIWLVFSKVESPIKSISYFVTGAIISFGLVSIALLPQLAWKDMTTRQLLTNNPQVFPIWESKIEFLISIFTPFWAEDGIQGINTEKYLFLGILSSLIAFFGFLKLKRKMKLIILVVGLILTLFALSNSSPFYNYLLNQDWYTVIRVPTRVWVVIILSIVFMAGFGYSKLEKPGIKGQLLKIFALFAIMESLVFSWIYFAKPIGDRNVVPPSILTKITSDKSDYRVLCMTRCIPQKTAVKEDIKLVDGYSTLIQTNYYQQAWSLTGGYWDHYSLQVPPSGVYRYQDLQPDINSLTAYNTKYIISDHTLVDEGFELLEQDHNFLLYENKSLTKKLVVPIISYSPNKIRFDTSALETSTFVTSEVYSSGWKARANGVDEIPVSENPIALRSINLPQDTDYIDLEYDPKSYQIGKSITLGTTTLLLIWTSYLISKRFLKSNP